MVERQKLSLPQLALLEWLCEKPQGKRMFAGSTSDSARLYFYDVVDQAEGKPRIVRIHPNYPGDSSDAQLDTEAFLVRMGGRDSIDHTPLARIGFLLSFNSLGHTHSSTSEGRQRHESFIAQYANNPFHFSQSARIVTKAGIEYWEHHGREQLAEARSAVEVAEAEVSRLVLIGVNQRISPQLPPDIQKLIPEGLPLSLPSIATKQPFAVARVVKQTAQRLYVRDVELLPRPGIVHSPIVGNPPNQYVAPDAVIIDHATRSVIRRYLDAESEFRSDYDRLIAEMASRILPVATEYYSRLVQKKAERDDTLREIIAGDAEPDDTPKP